MTTNPPAIGVSAYASPARGLRAMQRALAPRKPMTVSQWADAERRTSSKGSAIVGQWRTDRNPPQREPMDCLSARSAVREVVLMWPIQYGKDLALSTPLPTPTGWTTMGEVRPGDLVLGMDGQPTRVLGESEVFTRQDCYRLTFADGATVVAGAGHRWQVVDLASRAAARKEVKRRAARAGTARVRRVVDTDTAAHRRLLQTHELAACVRWGGGQARWAVEVAQPLELPAAALPIDPYLLGVWLGDGASATGVLSLNEVDAAHIMWRLSGAGYVVHAEKSAADQARGSQCITARVNPRGCGQQTFHAMLSACGLLGNKHIPTQYLRASRHQRLALSTAMQRVGTVGTGSTLVI